jgi:hypothetical protein
MQKALGSILSTVKTKKNPTLKTRNKKASFFLVGGVQSLGGSIGYWGLNIVMLSRQVIYHMSHTPSASS